MFLAGRFELLLNISEAVQKIKVSVETDTVVNHLFRVFVLPLHVNDVGCACYYY
jgi:hypothetical protein